jgi:hypothetical protein
VTEPHQPWPHLLRFTGPGPTSSLPSRALAPPPRSPALVPIILWQVFSTCWERLGAGEDDQAIRAAREAALGQMAPLRARLDAAMAKAGLHPSTPPPRANVVDVE